MPIPELEDDTDEYEVEEVRDKRTIKGRIHYLIKWVGWPSEYNQWVPEEDINAPQMIQDFEKGRSGKRKRQG